MMDLRRGDTSPLNKKPVKPDLRRTTPERLRTRPRLKALQTTGTHARRHRWSIVRCTNKKIRRTERCSA
jgi:hypothetical protein